MSVAPPPAPAGAPLTLQLQVLLAGSDRLTAPGQAADAYYIERIAVATTISEGTGNYNGEAFKSGTISQVIRPWENGHFLFPTSGTVEIDRPVFHFLIEFLGDDKATVTIKNKLTGKIHILYVDKNYNESDPQAQP